MDEETAYCICRSSDTNRFMIGCDSCNEWYHGDCISITEELAKTITKFYCLMCRDDNPSLKIEYHKESSSKQTAVKKKKQTRLSRTASTVDKTLNKKNHRQREREMIDFDDGLRQCNGPSCVNAARRGSKYCSDICGLALAKNRMYEILPSRLRLWHSTPSSADALSNQELESIRMEGEAAKKFLEDLDVQQKELEAMITEAKKLPPIPEDEIDESEFGDAEMMIDCVTCGHQIASRTALRHMERCFNKYESQTSVCSTNKCKVEGVFCDFYNAQQKTYCMRLKVLCPEHTKEQRIPDTKVCGFPLVANCFEFTGSYCRVPKKKCMKHYSWEKLRRAQLDMAKVQKWLKLEELFEREQKIRFSMANRGAVLGLLLHSTNYV